jgi:hypothetical protein
MKNKLRNQLQSIRKSNKNRKKKEEKEEENLKILISVLV